MLSAASEPHGAWLGLGHLRVAVRGAGARVDLFVGEDRVPVELLPNLVDQLESRELEQANRLLQLRRHHELLTELELLLDLHPIFPGGRIRQTWRARAAVAREEQPDGIAAVGTPASPEAETRRAPEGPVWDN